MNKSLEDYLKNIYTVHLSSGKVTNAILAEKMNITPAAVSEMVNKMSKSGYLKNTPYKGFELTRKGENAAINLVRKHRIWEVFLLKYLDYSWENVHNEAENLEHSSSDELIQKLEKFLQYPKYDPHGHPIPDINGNLPVNKFIRASELKEGESGKIRQVSDENSEVLVYLTKAGLKLNDEIKVIEKIKFDNSLHIKCSSGNIFLSEKLANSILVLR